MALNSDKTVFKSIPWSEQQTAINGTKLLSFIVCKDLGIYTTSDLIWDEHLRRKLDYFNGLLIRVQREIPFLSLISSQMNSL